MESNSGPDLRVLVVLDGDSIVVTMPGTSYSVTYRKLHDSRPRFSDQQIYFSSASVDRS